MDLDSVQLKNLFWSDQKFVFDLFRIFFVPVQSSGNFLFVVDFLFYSVASCFCLTRVQWLSLSLIFLLLLFSVFPPLRARFLAQICWSGFIFLGFPARHAARPFPSLLVLSASISLSRFSRITGPDSCFRFHFTVSRFGREARRLMKDLQSLICRSMEIQSKSSGPCSASGFRLGAAKSLCARIGFPIYQDLGPRKHHGSPFCRFPFSVFDPARSSLVFLLRWPDSRSSVICSTAKFCPLVFSL
jgi:hypothetical protein